MKRFPITLFSIGWLVPAWFGLSMLLTFLETDAWPLLRGGHPVNSFPYLAFSSRCFAAAFVWFGVAAAFWAWQLCGLTVGRPADVEPTAMPRDR